MKIRIRATEEKEKMLEEWHRWFSWHPVIVVDYNKTYWVWLGIIERRGHHYRNQFKDIWLWDYRIIY